MKNIILATVLVAISGTAYADYDYRAEFQREQDSYTAQFNREQDRAREQREANQRRMQRITDLANDQDRRNNEDYYWRNRY